MRKWPQDAGIWPRTQPPPHHLRLRPIWLEPRQYMVLGWDKWQETQEMHPPGMGQMAMAGASKPARRRPSGDGRMGAVGADSGAGVGEAGGPWSPGRPGKGSKTQGALGDRALKEARGRQGCRHTAA